MCPDSLTVAWTNWRPPQKDISKQYELRFYDDTFRDFSARIEWAEKGKGNRNPIVVVNRRSESSPIHITANKGEAIVLDASDSFDPDGDTIEFKWWIQSDAGHCPQEVLLTTQDAKATLTIPSDKPCEIHVVCEVRDNGHIPLVGYKRIIVTNLDI